MSIAERPAKNTICCTCRAGQSTFTQRVSAAPSGRTSGSPHTGQSFGNTHLRAPFLRLASTGPDDLGDHVAGLAHDHRVADAHVLARDLVLVVQRRHRHGGAADEHRLELRERRGAAGAADAHVDPEQLGRLLLGRELERDRPARRAAREAELGALREVVDLHHRTVDLVAERVAVLHRALAERDAPRRGRRALDVLVHREAELAEPRERLGVRAAAAGRRRPPRAGTVEREVARRGHARVLLAEAPAAALRGFANRRSPASPWRRLSSSNDESGMKISPRTSSRAGTRPRAEQPRRDHARWSRRWGDVLARSRRRRGWRRARGAPSS